MPGEDNLSSRFDYLFEPLDVEESVGDIETPERAADVDEKKGAPAVRLAFAAFVLATLGAATVVALLLLQQPVPPVGPADPPVEPDPLLTTAINIPTPAATVAPPPPTTAESVAPQTIQPVPTQQAVPASPRPTQAPSPREPRADTPKPPATRAPISVAPESRAPFPNQGPRTGGGGAGGLLGGLL